MRQKEKIKTKIKKKINVKIHDKIGHPSFFSPQKNDIDFVWPFIYRICLDIAHGMRSFFLLQFFSGPFFFSFSFLAHPPTNKQQTNKQTNKKIDFYMDLFLQLSTGI